MTFSKSIPVVISKIGGDDLTLLHKSCRKHKHSLLFSCWKERKIHLAPQMMVLLIEVIDKLSTISDSNVMYAKMGEVHSLSHTYSIRHDVKCQQVPLTQTKVELFAFRTALALCGINTVLKTFLIASILSILTWWHHVIAADLLFCWIEVS